MYYENYFSLVTLKVNTFLGFDLLRNHVTSKYDLNRKITSDMKYFISQDFYQYTFNSGFFTQDSWNISFYILLSI